MPLTREAEVSWFHRSGRESGVSRWGERPAWARHLTYWIVALALLSITLFDDDAGPATTSNDDLLTFVWLVIGILAIAVAALIFTLREWNKVGLLQRSRAAWCSSRSYSGLLLPGCSSPADSESRSTHVASSAYKRHVVARLPHERCWLGWQAADVVPIEITDSLKGGRLARVTL